MWKKTIKKILVAMMSSILLLVASYLYNNSPFPLFDDIEHYTWLELLRQKLSTEQEPANDFVYINVAYDKKFIPINDEYGMPLGNIDITDRKKLSQFIDLLHDADYKYIFMDVRFEKGYDDNEPYAEEDSCSMTVDENLFSLIRHTPRLVVANHRDIELAADSIRSKSALSDYMSTITATNFVRYEFIHDGQKSVPLHIYEELTNHSVTSWGPLYLDNGSLCSKSPFLQIPRPFAQNDGENKPFLNLGADILDEEMGGIGDDLKELVKGKYVVIGDFVNDNHDTYVGMQPGSYITSVATNYLFDGKHLVNWMSVLIMGLVYFIIALSMFRKKSVVTPKLNLIRFNSRTSRFVMSFFGITFLMYLVTDSIYLIEGETFCLWIPSLYFTILRTIITYSSSKSSIKN